MPLIAFDYKSFHVLTLGFEAQDPTYMRMARLDMHSYFALVGLLRTEKPDHLFPKSDEELLELFAWHKNSPTLYPEFGGRTFKEIRDERAKRAILGIGFGQGGRSLAMLHPESFASASDGDAVIDRLNGVFPRPEQWRTEVRVRADEDHQLVSRYGFVRRFWDVFQRRPVADNYQPRGRERVWVHRATGQKWLLLPGDDSEAAIAFLPANDAFGMIRERMAELGREGLDERFGLINQIHDSLVFDCVPARTDECLHTVKGILERPSPTLTDGVVAPGGLWCAVEAKLGPNLAEMVGADGRGR